MKSLWREIKILLKVSRGYECCCHEGILFHANCYFVSDAIGSEYVMPTDSMTFRWGRVDCDTSPDTADVHVFPDPTMNRTAMMAYFSDNYDMSETEVVALMGAHTLGGCTASQSGYRGLWKVDSPNYLNTKFYRFILGGESDATTPLDMINEVCRISTGRRH